MRRPLAALVVIACVLAAAHDAHAGSDFQVALGAGTRWLRNTPTLTAPAMSTSARELDQGAVPMRGGLAMLGGYADIQLTVHDRWTVPIIGGGVYNAVGSYDAIITSRDGSIVRARPWTAFAAEMLLPGIGYRLKRRRWMFGAALRGGIGWISMDGLQAAGAGSDAMEMTASTFFVQAELEGCRRLDPTTRVCLHLAPRVFEYELVNGAVLGLRVEWGK